jgi:dynactin complex subunit
MFAHKGKIGEVKFFGELPKKFGKWVGLELDEPTGDKNGEVNGEKIFDC